MFAQRLLSTVVMWSVVLGLVFLAPPFCSWGLLALLGSLALWELYTIIEKANLRVLKLWGITAGFVLLTGSWFFFKHGVVSAKSHGFEAAVLSLAVGGAFVWTLTQKDNPKPIETMAATIFGVVYVSWLFNFITKIHYIHPAEMLECGHRLFCGKYAVLYLVLVTKFSDAGAYVTGRLLGRHKLIPRVSPGKTWEGTVGGVVVAALAGWGTFFLFRESLEQLGMTAMHSLVVGALLGVVGIVGDLAESLIKREAGVKDSGSWLPGIGGMLDLIDSLLFTAPALYAYLRLILRSS